MKKQTVFQVRQGDVFIKAIEEIPADAELVEKNSSKVILAYGEITGHAHAVHGEKNLSYYADKKDPNLLAYLIVDRFESLLTHPDHYSKDLNRDKLPVGKYEIRRQTEYTPQELRRVND